MHIFSHWKKHIHVVQHGPNLPRVTIFFPIIYFTNNNDKYIEMTQVLGITQFGTLEIVKLQLPLFYGFITFSYKL
jgi:hypothetical protein